MLLSPAWHPHAEYIARQLPHPQFPGKSLTL